MFPRSIATRKIRADLGGKGEEDGNVHHTKSPAIANHKLSVIVCNKVHNILE